RINRPAAPAQPPYEDLPTAAMPRTGYDQPPAASAPARQAPAPQGGYIPAQRPRPAPQAPAQAQEAINVEPAPSFVRPVPHRGVPATPGQAVQKKRGPIGLILGVFAGLIVLVLLGAFAYAGWYEQQYAGRIYPGVTVLGQDVGGMDPTQAQALVQSKVA